METIKERKDGSRRVSFTCRDNRVKPEFANDADINRIMAKYTKTGLLGDPFNMRKVVFGDFSDGDDYAEVERKIAVAREAFYSLDSSIRNEFHNDPAELLNFLVDPKNDERAVQLGLKLPKAEPAAKAAKAEPAAKKTESAEKPAS